MEQYKHVFDCRVSSKNPEFLLFSQRSEASMYEATETKDSGGYLTRNTTRVSEPKQDYHELHTQSKREVQR